jgi:cyclophilin family peptidyl-prolyl cis-trans isomerase
MRLLATATLLAALAGAGAPALADNPKVLITTSKGPITAELYADKAPGTVKNFLEYVDAGFFDGTVFHRVIDGFMIQGGGYTESMERKETRDPIQNEADNGLKNERGTLAMARTGDPHSATAQFFINHQDNDFLDHTGKNPRGWGYTVFGKVTDGMDVVDAIATTPTGISAGMKDVPTTPILIERVTRAGE